MISVATSYNHTQSSSDTVWSITHGLNIAVPVVDCFIIYGGAYTKIIPADVVVIDSNTIEIHWSEATAGKARIV